MDKTTTTTERPFNPEEALAALERGELVQLLAEIEAGNTDPKELEKVLERHANKHWFKRLIAWLLTRQ